MEGEIKKNSQNQYLIPASIVLAGLFVAVGLYMSGGNSTQPTQVANNGAPTQAQPAPPAGNTDAVRAVTAEDHIKGNPDAPVKIVEYSDFECPFCKRFHDTMNSIMDKQGDSGEVAWVFRHFPLDQLHSKARSVAVASECANEQGGNDAFWQFTDTYFKRTLTNNRTDIETVIPQIVREIGLDTATFDTCFQSGKYDQHVEDDVQNAIATGGRGTPWSVVIAPNGKTFSLNGAQPAASVEQLIQIASQEK